MIVERLKQLRNDYQISQKDFAEAIGVAQQTVASWEVGRTEPANNALKEIADYFHFLIYNQRCFSSLTNLMTKENIY